jgi:putative endonuclease
MDKRLQRHNAGMVASTRPYLPWVVVYQEVYETKQEANARERYVKRMKSRKFIEALIITGKRSGETGRHVPIINRDSPQRE